MQLLMCKDVPVYNVTTQTLLNKALAPGQLAKEPSADMFRIWAQARYSSQTNVIARRVQGGTFGQGNRQYINQVTKSLSLSDSYWLKDNSDGSSFNEVSPYYVDFWKGEDNYKGQSVPTLYTDGVLPKYWLDRNTLIKQAPQVEIECAKLAKDIGLSVADVWCFGEGYIAVKSFTNPDIMYEAADTSGLLDVADFTYQDVLEVFGEKGLDMLVFDAVVGNIDRHTGNFGFLKCANTGVHLNMAPLFDFDQALSPNEIDFSLIRAVVKFVKDTSNMTHALGLIEKIKKQTTLPEIIERARLMKELLHDNER